MEILSLTLDQLTYGLKKNYGKGNFHASALLRKIVKSGDRNFMNAPEFANSPAFARKLAEQLTIKPGRVRSTYEEGSLTKFITQLEDGESIESVIIPMSRYNTLCISSQAGCKMGCRFCRTAKMGFKRNLDVHEITGQLFNARFTLKKKIKNIVFMGMGEPFDNFDAVIQAIRVMNEQKGFDIALRHITVSTCGLASGIKKLNSLEMPGLRLAVSINAADDSTRSRLMPVNRQYPLAELKKALQHFRLGTRGGFLFEYILIKGLNDSPDDAIKLSDYIKPLPVRLNLIPLNPVTGFNHESPCDDDMHRFADILRGKGVFVIKRWTKGRSVAAGCGQLGS